MPNGVLLLSLAAERESVPSGFINSLLLYVGGVQQLYGLPYPFRHIHPVHSCRFRYKFSTRFTNLSSLNPNTYYIEGARKSVAKLGHFFVIRGMWEEETTDNKFIGCFLNTDCTDLTDRAWETRIMTLLA